MKELIKKYLIENLEIVKVKDGGGDSTAIAIKMTTCDWVQDKEGIEMEAGWLAEKLAKGIEAKLMAN